MHQFLRDILIARGWSIRHLSELTGLSYSGVRDYLHGHPARLSHTRLIRVYDLLQLDHESGILRPDTLYTWRVGTDSESMNALNRILRVMIEVTPIPEEHTEQNDPHRLLFRAIPLIGGSSPALPAPFCVLTWKNYWLLIQWSIPAREMRKIGSFHAPHKTHSSDQLPRAVAPNMDQLSYANWANDMEVSAERLKGIFLTPSQLTRLNSLDTSTEKVSCSELIEWINTEPTEDTQWQQALKKQNDWSWELVLEKIQHRYGTPEQAAQGLKLL
jgi:transcriptional regulator with XRE-family HTH domain